MGDHRAADPAGQARRASAGSRHARGAQHPVLSRPYRLPVGHVAPRSVAQEYGLRRLLPLARRRHLAADHGRLARRSADPGGPGTDAQRRLDRQPNGQNHRDGRRTRLRRRQEDQRPKTPRLRRHPGHGPGGGRHQRRGGRRGRRAASVRAARRRPLPAVDESLGGQQVPQPQAAWVDRGGTAGLGLGGHFAAPRSPWIRAAAQALGGRADVCVPFPTCSCRTCS